MCHRSKGCAAAPMTAKITKIVLVLVLFCFTESAAGSCLSYGHSCLGAHGKRNEGGREVDVKINPSDLLLNRRILFSRLFQKPTDDKYWRGKDLSILRTLEKQIEDETDSLKRQEDDFQETLLDDDSLYSDEIAAHPKLSPEKLHLFKLMKGSKIN